MTIEPHSTVKMYLPSLFKKEFLCNSIYVAGGAAVNLSKASDIDIWFGRGDRDRAEAFVKGFPISRLVTKANGYPFKEIVGEAYYIGANRLIQVMVTEDKLAAERIDKFDISTHMWAITSRGELIKGPRATGTADPPVVVNINRHSVSRYIKICRRYGFDPDLGILTTLSQYNGE